MHVIGLDIGGTKIEGVLVKAEAARAIPKILKKLRIPANASAGKAAVIGGIAGVIAALHEYGRENVRGYRLRGIGIGTAGFLKNGKMEMVPNIPCLKGARLMDVLSRQLQARKINAPVFIENDSICFALAESLFGAGRGFRNVIGIIIGTGIGSGLVLDGKAYYGRDGGAGHIGHTTIDPSGPKCGCGQRGHFEAWCSGRHIALRYKAAGGRMANPDAASIFEAASKGSDDVAVKIVEETHDKFGLALANVINTFNPDLIVLGGGVSNLPASFYREISSAAGKYSYPAFFERLRIVRNRLGDSAGVFGAAALALKNQGAPIRRNSFSSTNRCYSKLRK